MSLSVLEQREIAAWPEEDRELWSERAAIMQFDGGMSCPDAERAAFLLVKQGRLSRAHTIAEAK